MISANILGDRNFNHDTLIAWLKLARPKYAVLMDNAPLAQRIMAECPATQIVFRMWTNDDDSHVKTDPADYIRQRHNTAPLGAAIYVTNEPGGNYPRLNEWTLTTMQECDRWNRRAVIFNMPTGNPEKSTWAVLAPAIEYAYAHHHAIGLHEYFSGKVENSVPWHVGRFQALKDFAGARCPELIITEFGCAVGMDAYAGWQGALTEQAYADELANAARLYHDGGVGGACIFSWGDWHTFGIENAPALLSRLAATNEELKIISEQPTTWIEGTVRPAGNYTVNIRASASTTSAKLGLLEGEEACTYAAAGDWTHIRLARGLEGYVSNAFVILGAPIIVPPPDPEQIAVSRNLLLNIRMGLQQSVSALDEVLGAEIAAQRAPHR